MPLAVAIQVHLFVGAHFRTHGPEFDPGPAVAAKRRAYLGFVHRFPSGAPRSTRALNLQAPAAEARMPGEEVCEADRRFYRTEDCV